MIYDVTILGAGPTGLFAAFYAGMRQMSCKIVDSLPQIGGRLTAVYPEKHIYDVAGFPKVLAKDLVSSLEQQIRPYNTSLCLGEQVQSIERQEDGTWHILTQTSVHKTRTLIIAGGTGLYAPKKHTAPGAQEWEAQGRLVYAVMEKAAFSEENVAIVGGGDSALDWALELQPYARSLTLIHRSTTFRAHEDSVRKLRQAAIPEKLNYEVAAFEEEGLRLRHVETQEECFVPASKAVVQIGFHSSLGKLPTWGLAMEKNGILVNEKMETNLPGVFAAGDITRHPGKLDLIVTGFAEAAVAIAFAKNYINPKERPQPLHSTTLVERGLLKVT